jgi:NitT/TauT family transport system permease protein
MSARQGTIALRAGALSVALLAVLLAAWQLASASGTISPLILPRPLDVLNVLVTGLGRGIWYGDILFTLEETLIGFLTGVASAIVIGAVFAASETLRRALYPFVVAIQAFPKIAVAPLLMAWFGYGLLPKVAIAAMLAFFPVFTNTLAGFLEVDPALVELFHSMRASRWQELRHLRLPNAIVFIVPSFDVALVLALLGAIAGELAGSAAGMGNVIQQRTFLGDTAAVYAVLLLLGVIGILLRQAMRLLVFLALRKPRRRTAVPSTEPRPVP